MSSQSLTSMPYLDQMIDDLVHQFQTYKSNFTNQVNATFTRLTPKDVIRLVIIAGAYCLLRPYIIKAGARFQTQDHERELDHEEIQDMRKSEGYNKGSLKGQVEIPEDTDSESDGEGAKTTGTSWGKKARRRQRMVMRKLLEAEEKRRLEDEEAESDKELEQWMEK